MDKYGISLLKHGGIVEGDYKYVGVLLRVDQSIGPGVLAGMAHELTGATEVYVGEVPPSAAFVHDQPNQAALLGFGYLIEGMAEAVKDKYG